MIEITSEPLLVKRLADGKRELQRAFVLNIDGERCAIPEKFVTDYSSWPRWIPGPRYDKIDIAGVVHDYLFKYGTLGEGGRSVSYTEANRIWYKVARAGNEKTRLNLTWAWTGRIGLYLCSWPTWIKYKKARRGAARAKRV